MKSLRALENTLACWLSDLSIRRKLLYSCVVGLLVSSLAISGVLIALNYRINYDTTLRLSYASLDQVATGVTAQLLAQRATLDSLKGYGPLSAYFKRDYRSEYDNYLHFTECVYPGLKLISESSGDIKLRIYSTSDMVSFSQITGGRIEELLHADWFDAKASQQYGSAWGLTRMFSAGAWQQALCSYASMFLQDRSTDYVIAVFLGEHQIRRQLDQPDGGVTLLLDGEGAVVSASLPELVGKLTPQLSELEGIDFGTAPADSVCEFRSERYLLMRRALSLPTLGLEGWQVVHLTPYEQVTRDVVDMARRSVLITLLILSAFLALALLMASHMSRRLGILVDKMGAVSRGDFKAGERVPGTDEIARINQCFDDMVQQIRVLIDDNEEIHRRLLQKSRAEQEILLRQRDAELGALRAQINPHFLFNTLETIRMNLLLGGDRESARVMLLFAESIREYMQPAGTFSVLEDELHFVDKYIFIQQYRFGERVRFSTDVPDALKGRLVPRLMLQPLIENAIHHGIEPRNEGGHVVLRAWRERGALVFSVEDDGVGMGAEQLKRLIRHIHDEGDERSDAAGLGLRNVQRRIELLYGAEYGLWIESVPGKGTRIRVTLPDTDAEE